MLNLILYASDMYGALGSYGTGYYGFDWTYILVVIGAAYNLIDGIKKANLLS